MFKKKGPAEECPSCGAGVHHGQKVCACGSATRFMSFEERAAYEVQLWRTHRQRLADAQA